MVSRLMNVYPVYNKLRIKCLISGLLFCDLFRSIFHYTLPLYMELQKNRDLLL